MRALTAIMAAAAAALCSRAALAFDAAAQRLDRIERTFHPRDRTCSACAIRAADRPMGHLAAVCDSCGRPIPLTSEKGPGCATNEPLDS